MTLIRRAASFAALAAVLAIGSAAQASPYKDKQYTPHMGGGIPLVTSNSVTANNIAAGYGNKANQNIFADQSGAGGYKWQGGKPGGLTSNSVDATNLAAGFGNRANQDIMASQRGSGGLTLNSVDALNLAVGEHNRADQRVMTDQR